MRKKPEDMQVGNRFVSDKNGTLEIIDYETSSKVKVKFINTGTITYGSADAIRKGSVRDPYAPNISNIGYMGEGNYKSNTHRHIYMTWFSMLRRCYETHKTNSPTYADCSVCVAWHNFQIFAKWFEEHHQPNTQIDKDIKKAGNHIYSPNTCTFVTHQENSEQVHAKSFLIMDPQGNTHRIYNLMKFCREVGINVHRMYLVRAGKLDNEKGWKLLTHGESP